MGIGNQLKHAWNAFTNQDEERQIFSGDLGAGYSVRPDRSSIGIRVANERSIITSIYTRMAIDYASIDQRHVRLDDQGRYVGDIKSALNDCLTVEANLDQEARAFRQDEAMSLFEKGHIAIVPTDATMNPEETGGFDVNKTRIGTVVQWYPEHVRVRVYNEKTGRYEELTVMKKVVALVENPLYPVMNEPNSTLQRIIRKLNLLDSVDEQSSSGKLDMIIQLPYVVRTDARRQQADQRRKDIEFQLKGSQYGIAYTDGTEKITQLNRPAENNLLKQVEYLMTMLYAQLGITEEVMNGTADEKTMINYFNRTIEPLLGAVTGEKKRKFLSKTARTQGQSIEYFRDAFKLVPLADLAELGDKFTRNEILTSNEFRGVMGFKPSTDPKADKLLNSNMPAEKRGDLEGETSGAPTPPPADGSSELLAQTFDDINSQLDDVFKELGEEPDAEQA